ncbi:unnamed protein product [Macrosiphum euphorbiae]|uniref:Uncharacterized protein n=1 Tax=Macrosiphum euphorbiae TaxID=13131 RepID=A0AAV0W9R2_9HEMI|nr:unnamed protein product [Macrosiphum euphorbiae]
MSSDRTTIIINFILVGVCLVAYKCAFIATIVLHLFGLLHYRLLLLKLPTIYPFPDILLFLGFFFVISNRTGTKITDNSNASSSRPITHLQASKPASLTVSSPTKSTNADIMNALTDFRAEFLSNSKAQSDASSSQFRQLKGELGRLVSQVSEVRKLSITERGCYS